MSNPSPQDFRKLLEQSYLQVKNMQSRIAKLEYAKTEPIAIVGMGCRFPGNIDSPEAFWQFLREGKDAITEIPKERWEVDDFYHLDPSMPGKMITRWGGFLRDPALFDASFFGIPSLEARCMDPQQRLLLEVAWEALEDAGIPIERIKGSKTGVFVGISSLSNDYSYFQFFNPADIGVYSGTGTAHDSASARLSYLLNLVGPSISIDSACSSSLVAVHLACQSLRNGEINLALAAGVHLILSPQFLIALTKMRLLSSDGRCKTFDAQANGIVMSEGCGIVVLKRLSDALADGDCVLALIRGSAINQDGYSAGMTAPNALSQRAVIRQALFNAGVEPAEISYVETHGTGTSLGDPVEVGSLIEVLGHTRTTPCVLGSVKTNLGHLGSVSGIAGLIKTVLCLRHSEIPPNLHFKKLNPSISLAADSYIIPMTNYEWKVGSGPHFAGVSAFGWGGTNAHLVLEEASPIKDAYYPENASLLNHIYLLPFSARSPEALRSLAREYQKALTSDTQLAQLPLYDICAMAALRRSHHPYRHALIGKNHAEINAQLDRYFQKEVARTSSSLEDSQYISHPTRTVFVFTGQGALWIGMGRRLMEREPVFCKMLEQCDSLIQQYASWSIIEELLREGEDYSRLDDTSIAQPLLFSLQVALTELWRLWGIEPEVVIGHSMGEITAAYVAGVLNLEKAIQLVCHRGRLMRRAHGQGKMMAVDLPLREIDCIISEYEPRLCVAAINSPTSLVLAGELEALLEVEGLLQKREIFCRLLDGQYAFHSPQMEPFRAEMVHVSEHLIPQTAKKRIISSVTGHTCEGPEMDSIYWGRNMCEPVRFVQAIETLLADLQDEHISFLEIGPHPMLSRAIAQSLREKGINGDVFPSLRHQEDDYRVLFQTLASFYTLGYNVHWELLYATRARPVSLPLYSWQRQRYWIETETSQHPALISTSRASNDAFSTQTHPFLGQWLSTPTQETFFSTHFSAESPLYLNDHRMHGMIVVPAASHISMLLSATQIVVGTTTCLLEDVQILRPLTLTAGQSRVLQIALTQDTSDQSIFKIFSRNITSHRNDWVLHLRGTLRTTRILKKKRSETLPEVQSRCQEVFPGTKFYQDFWQSGYQLGSRFRWIETFWRRDGEALCFLKMAVESTEDQDYVLHPGLIDSCFQTLCISIQAGGISHFIADDHLYVPVSIGNFRLYSPLSPGDSLWCHALLKKGSETDSEIFSGDLQLFNQKGSIIADVNDLCLKRSMSKSFLQSSTHDFNQWLYQLIWQTKAIEQKLTEQETSQKGCWLIFADNQGVGTRIAKRMDLLGEICYLVFSGEEASVLKQGVANRWNNNQNNFNGIEELVTALTRQNIPPCKGFIYLWSLDIPQVQGHEESMFSTIQEQLGGSLLQVIQLVEQTQWVELPHLWLITQHVHSIETEDRSSSFAQGSFWGLGRVISNELSYLRCSLIDLGSLENEDEVDTLIQELLTSDNENEIALRGTRRYVARLVHPQRHPGTKLDREQHLINSEGTYLITGGLGSLGQVIAGWLVEHGARHLVLIGKSAASATMRQSLDAWHKTGVEVKVFQVDVSELKQVVALIEHIDRSMAPLKGIVHAAAVLEDKTLMEISQESLKSVLSPKVSGAWNLHFSTLEQDLDFFVLFSSATSLLGMPGQASYAAANAFMDTLANYRHYLEKPALSINWGHWASTGMTTRSQLGERLGARGLAAMLPEQAAAAFGHILSQHSAQVCIMDFDAEQWCSYYPSAARSSLLHDLLDVSERFDKAYERSKSFRDIFLATKSDQQKSYLLKDHLQMQIANILNIPYSKIDTSKPMSDHQIDSLITLEIINILKDSLKITLPTALLMGHSTIDDITNYILDKFEIPTISNGDIDESSTLQKKRVVLKNDKEFASLLEDFPDNTVESILKTLEEQLMQEEGDDELGNNGQMNEK